MNDSTGWPRIPLVRRIGAWFRASLCSRFCPTFNRTASQLVDELNSEVERLREGGRT